MKYQIPDLRVLNKMSVNAVCSQGSSAAGGTCMNGSIASGGCSSGNTADVINCETGGAADFLGPWACTAMGADPKIACLDGASV
jgi:hypothetical protein